MRKKITFLMIALVTGCMTSMGQVIISQIYEGTSNNKFIELTNMGSSTVDLASPQLSVALFSNKSQIGVNTPTSTLNLTGTLNAGQSLVIRHSSAVNPAYAVSYTPGLTGTVCNFNGAGTDTTNTDIIALYNGTTLLDVFAWGGFVYTDQSYYRNLTVTAGNPTWTVGEWINVSIANVDAALPSTLERLGYHGAPSTDPIIMIDAPVNGTNVYGANANITFTLYNFVINTDGHIHYTVDGGSATDHTSTGPITVPGLTAGSHTVILTLVDNASAPLNPNVADTVTFNTILSVPNLKTIYQIQYTTDTSGNSPLMDSIVTTTGIVTASYAGGYFIQDGGTPWNGLYVYDNANSAAEGDSIVITGTVTEYYKCTELKTITAYSLVAWNKPLPAPNTVTTTSVRGEEYEGLLVYLHDAVCTYVHTSGWWNVLQGTDTCEIGKLIFSYPTAIVGNHYDVTGVVQFTFGANVIEPRDINDIQNLSAIGENRKDVFVMYPNPATDMVYIKLNTPCDQVSITDMYGRLIKSIRVNDSDLTADIAGLASGCYLLNVIEKGQRIANKIIVKQ